MMRRASKNTRGPITEEREFQKWLKQQPCCVGTGGLVEVHHCKGSAFKHNKVLIGHWFCIPLSQSAHREYHAGTKPWRNKYGPQSDLWHAQAIKYIEDTGREIPDAVIASIMDCGV